MSRRLPRSRGNKSQIFQGSGDPRYYWPCWWLYSDPSPDVCTFCCWSDLTYKNRRTGKIDLLKYYYYPPLFHHISETFKSARSMTDQRYPNIRIGFAGICRFNINRYNRMCGYSPYQWLIDSVTDMINKQILNDNVAHPIVWHWHPKYIDAAENMATATSTASCMTGCIFREQLMRIGQEISDYFIGRTTHMNDDFYIALFPSDLWQMLLQKKYPSFVAFATASILCPLYLKCGMGCSGSLLWFVLFDWLFAVLGIIYPLAQSINLNYDSLSVNFASTIW